MADATPLIDDDDWEIKDADKTKKGRKFFGCCCDSRRAVIVTNILDIILCIILYICSAFQTSLSGLQITVWVVNQIWNTATILGAFYYSDIIVIMGVLWQLFKMSAIIYHFAEYYAPSKSLEERVALIFYLCIAIPLIILTIFANSLFAFEVRRNIMSKETYKKRERYSCCCV